MNVLVLTDTMGNEIYVNPGHVSKVTKAYGSTHAINANGLVHFTDGTTQVVQETAGAVCFRLLEL